MKREKITVIESERRDLSEYSLVFMIISVAGLMSLITLPNETIAVLKKIVLFFF
ncbi:hypothetical protein [Bacillus sp. CGMCC 1.16541]|uniref:hypothetical protein n=1 Tax=Bacillus sp. CGMCC 1.16541 TaxID=2185143 RepID=UPI0013A55540|nr:hypothetical protein [Bacillus sp. CGMCC 1.16541]